MTEKNQIQLDILNNANELISLCKEFNYLNYKCDIRDITEDEKTRLILLANQLSQYPNEYQNNAMLLVKSLYTKRCKLKSKIENMLSLKEKYYCDVYFITMTFNDGVFNKTSKQTRKKYITRYLKENYVCYVANIDYGDKSGREHYHACVVASKNNYKYLRDNYIKYFNECIINFEPVNKKNSEIRISKYITKLSSHAFKESTKREHILYSKNDASSIKNLEPRNKIEYKQVDNWLCVEDNQPLPFEKRSEQSKITRADNKLKILYAEEWHKYAEDNGIKKTDHIPKNLLFIIKKRVEERTK